MAVNVGLPLFEGQRDHRMAMRKEVYQARGLTLDKTIETGAAPKKAAARNVTKHSLLCGSPATVAEQVAEIDAVGVGTPDHTHFAITYMAKSMGKHVFVEKPLVHSYTPRAILKKIIYHPYSRLTQPRRLASMQYQH